MFNRYYQEELSYLRELGREFSAAYPALAPMLADRGADPDVERLLEGVAFLTGRIRQKLDDELPEVIFAVAELLFPHLVRSLPAASILEITPLPNVLRERHRVPAGAEFGSVRIDGTSCRFRSCYDCELIPWTIEDTRIELLAGGDQQLRVEFATQGSFDTHQLSPERLRLHLTGEDGLTLLMWMLERTLDVVLIAPKSKAGPEREISLGKQCLRHVGFDDGEELLPTTRGVFPGFRLLQEYYTLPSKFAFVDIEHMDRLMELGKELGGFSVAFRFDTPLPTARKVQRDTVKIHCVPVINVFATTAEPIHLTAEREHYFVQPAGIPAAHGEVYSINHVEAILRGSSDRITIRPFFQFSHAITADSTDQFFYTPHLTPGVVGDTTRVAISIGTTHSEGVLPEADVLSIDILATNGPIAGSLRAGDISVATPNSPAIATFKNLTAATQHIPPPRGRDLHWRVVAHASMGLRGLTELPVLRSVLDVYNFHALVDRQVARANELRLAAVRELTVSPFERLYRGAPVRGAKIDIELDESGFQNDGDMYLFGSIIERFFAAYVSINSFSQTAIHGTQSKVKFSWPARNGNLTML